MNWRRARRCDAGACVTVGHHASEVEELAIELADERMLTERLAKALQVCEHTLHLVNPSSADIHAAQQASGAWVTDWRPDEVYDDLPEFAYATIPTGAGS